MSQAASWLWNLPYCSVPGHLWERALSLGVFRSWAGSVSLEARHPRERRQFPVIGKGVYGGRGGCQVCRHVTKMGAQDSEEGWRCAAFPEKDIPAMIFAGFSPHTVPYPYDNGIQFSVNVLRVVDDVGTPCFQYHDWDGCTRVVETQAELPPWAVLPKPGFIKRLVGE